MLDVRDPSFKLFGETIPVLSADEISGDSTDNACSNSPQDTETDLQSRKEQAEQNSTDERAEDDPAAIKAADKTDHQTLSVATDENQNAPNCLDENSADGPQKDNERSQVEEPKNSDNNPEEKTLKKPDKILPCPRCNSMDTKFCYYNNYNVNQPRHFCKSCQRYWTAGGTMRNVPVGAGRRKNKTSSSRYCQISISDALQAARIDLPNGLQHARDQPEANLKMNGTVLTFGANPPLCDSMASMMNLAEKKAPNGTRNGENVDDRSTGSSAVTTSSSMEEGSTKHQIPQNVNGFAGHQVPCFPSFQLPYGWNPAVPFPPPPPGYFVPAGFPPMPFYPAPYWNGAAMPMPWNGPWFSPNSSSPKSAGSNAGSPTLGKHSRDEDSLNPSNGAEKSSGSSRVLVPKTLRIDDPEEAAKSSIWTTLGIKKVEPAANGGFFKGLQSKGEQKKHKIEISPALNANPAAMARSIRFQETA